MNHFSKPLPLTDVAVPSDGAPRQASTQGAGKSAQASAVPREAGVRAAEAGAGPAPRSVALELEEKQLLRIQDFLVNGATPIARRRDVIEHYNRMIELFKTLNKGLSERQAAAAEADRKAVSDRLNALEKALNDVEGVLRIEITPVLSEMRDQAAGASHERGGRGRAAFICVVIASIAVVMGAMFAEPIKQASQDLAAFALEKVQVRG